jgi:hypothetical protein
VAENLTALRVSLTIRGKGCGPAASGTSSCSVGLNKEVPSMERKGGSSTAVVTSAEVKAALGKKSRALVAEEEKALRMRHGGKVDLQAPLARASGGNAELEDELLLIEMQLMKAMRARTGANPVATTPTAPNAAAKSKIVRMLKKKK